MAGRPLSLALAIALLASTAAGQDEAGDDRALRDSIGRLASPEWEVREEAVLEVAGFGEAAEPLLVQALRDAEPEVAERIYRVRRLRDLVREHGSDAVDALRSSREPDDRRRLLQALLDLGIAARFLVLEALRSAEVPWEVEWVGWRPWVEPGESLDLGVRLVNRGTAGAWVDSRRIRLTLAIGRPDQVAGDFAFLGASGAFVAAREWTERTVERDVVLDDSAPEAPPAAQLEACEFVTPGRWIQIPLPGARAPGDRFAAHDLELVVHGDAVRTRFRLDESGARTVPFDLPAIHATRKARLWVLPPPDPTRSESRGLRVEFEEPRFVRRADWKATLVAENAGPGRYLFLPDATGEGLAGVFHVVRRIGDSEVVASGRFGGKSGPFLVSLDERWPVAAGRTRRIPLTLPIDLPAGRYLWTIGIGHGSVDPALDPGADRYWLGEATAPGVEVEVVDP